MKYYFVVHDTEYRERECRRQHKQSWDCLDASTMVVALPAPAKPQMKRHNCKAPEKDCQLWRLLAQTASVHGSVNDSERKCTVMLVGRRGTSHVLL